MAHTTFWHSRDKYLLVFMMQSRCNLVMETTWHYEIVQKIRSQHYAAFNLDSDEVNNVLGFRPRFPGSLVRFPVQTKTLSFTTSSSVSDPRVKQRRPSYIYLLYGALGSKQKVS